MLKLYKYYDKSNEGKLVYAVLAKDILEADKKLKSYTGIDVVKKPHIGCQIEKLVKADANES